MVFMAGPAIAFGASDETIRLPVLAQLDISYGYFILPNLALGVLGSTVVINPDEEFHYDCGVGPQMMFFIGGGEFGDETRNRLYPYISLAYIYRQYDWRIKCIGYITPPPPEGWPAGDCHNCYDNHGGALRGTLGVARTLSDKVGYNVRVALQYKDINDCAVLDLTIGLDFFTFIK